MPRQWRCKPKQNAFVTNSVCISSNFVWFEIRSRYGCKGSSPPSSSLCVDHVRELKITLARWFSMLETSLQICTFRKLPQTKMKCDRVPVSASTCQSIAYATNELVWTQNFFLLIIIFHVFGIKAAQICCECDAFRFDSGLVHESHLSEFFRAKKHFQRVNPNSNAKRNIYRVIRQLWNSSFATVLWLFVRVVLHFKSISFIRSWHSIIDDVKIVPDTNTHTCAVVSMECWKYN